MTAALQLDFAARKGRTGPVLLLLAMVLLCWCGWRYQQLQQVLQQQNQLQAKQQAARLKSLPVVPQPTQVEREQLQAELKAANRIIDKLALPWDALFRAIESAADGQTSLLSVEPDTEKKTLRIQAQASDLPAMLAYQARLNALPLIRHAHVVSHQLQVQEPARPVRFELLAEWRDSDIPLATAVPAGIVASAPAVLKGGR